MNTTNIIILGGSGVFALMLAFTIILFIRGGGRRGPNYRQPAFGFLTKCLLRLSGHHPSEFDRLDPSVAWRFAACGLSVLVPPTIAFLGVVLACRVFEIGGGLGFATAVGAFILMLDFILVAALSGSRSGWPGWALAIYRALLAFAIGWFIARPAILLIYGGAIDGTNRSNQWEAIRQTTEQRENLRRAAITADQPLAEHYAARRKELEEQLKGITPLKQQLSKDILEDEKRREEEDLHGRDGRKPGRGDFWTAEGTYLDQRKEKLAKLEAEENNLAAQLQALAQNQETQFAKANDDPALRALGDAAGKQIVDLKNHTAGWAEREDLMISWVMERPVKRLPGFIFIHVALLLLDLLPLLTLLLADRAELDEVRRSRRARLKAETDCIERVAKESVEELILEQLTRDRFRELSTTVKENGDARLQFASHQILRQAQAEAAARPAFFKLRFGTTKPTPEQAAEWEKASEPLRRAIQQNLRDFENLMG
jgi:hypothetical protein